MTATEAVIDLLVEWETRRNRGTPVAPEELCRDRPELLDELRFYLRKLNRLDGLLTIGGRATEALPAIPGYEIVAEIGGGGMGVVYEARDRQLGRTVAVKVPRGAALLAPRARERFEREGRALAALEHPNIVPVHSAGVAGGLPFIVLSYVRGGTLARHRPPAGDPERAVALAETIARAVGFAHARGFVHRDLKPSNILLGDGGRPLVADFGIAALWSIGAEEGGREAVEGGPSEGLTQTGMNLGTPPYMAPEQSGGGAVGPAADVWAMGVMLAELLTARPFGGDVASATRGVPARLAPVLRRCLDPDPRRRYRDGTELADALAAWLSARRRRRVLSRFVLALVPAAALVAALIFFLRPAPPLDAHQKYLKAVAPALKRLKAGESVTLLGPGTQPVFFAREGASLERTAEGWSATSLGIGRVELLPEVPCSHYRLVAEIQFSRMNSHPDYHLVGLYHRGADAVSGTRQSHLSECLWTNIGREGKRPPRTLHFRQLAVDQIAMQTERANPFRFWALDNDHEGANWTVPAGHDPEGWWTVALSVEPDRAVAHVQSQEVPSVARSFAPLREQERRLLLERVYAAPAEFFAPLRQTPADRLRTGAVGLLTCCGRCCVRRLEVVPLQPGRP